LFSLRLTDEEESAVQSISAQEAAHDAVSSIFEIAEADGVALYWWSEGKRILTPLAYTGPLLERKALPIVHPGQGALGAAYSERSPIMIDRDYASSPYMTAWARELGIESQYAVPLLVRRRVMGVLSVMYAKPHTIDAGVRRMIELIAKQVAPMLAVMGLLSEADHSVGESITLSKLISDTATYVDVSATCERITETACRLLGADYGAVGVLEPDGSARFYGMWGARAPLWRSNPRNHLFGGIEEDYGRTFVITNLPDRPDASRDEFANSLSEGGRTVMVTPLGDEKKRLGSLLVGWRVDVKPTLRQIKLLEMLAKHATLVVVHAKAIQRVVERQGEHSPEEHYRTLAEHAKALTLVVDDALVIQYASPSHRTMLGWEPQTMVGSGLLEYVLPADLPMLERQITQAREAGGHMEGVRFRVRHNDGSTRMLEFQGNNHAEDPLIGGWLLHSRDVTERDGEEGGSSGKISVDSLERLLDRAEIDNALHVATIDAHAQESPLALIVVELDRFGSLGNSVRADVADRLFRDVGDRLRSVLRAGDRIGRLGADEFVIISLHADEFLVRERVDTLLSVMEKPFLINGTQHRFEVSLGIALYPLHGLDARTLLRHANAATRLAKRTRSGFAFYDKESDRSAAARVLAVSALREAIAQDELRLHCQPILDIRTKKIIQAEVLCRWPSAPTGLKEPSAFIPLAEHTGLITGLTDWVMRHAIEQWARWGASMPASLSINLSMENLAEQDIAERLARILKENDIPASRVCLELTESALLVDVDRSARTLEKFVSMGVHFSIDDFGTGYTSLSYLNRFPIHELKIDRSFVAGMENDARNRTIVRSIIDLAHGLGLSVVAEGVETQPSLDMLTEWGCDLVQGHLLAPAMSSEEFAALFCSKE
jgi:diguanylate cyclase (GGDEF)-like protein/PAS domain S-box-containing protein